MHCSGLHELTQPSLKRAKSVRDAFPPLPRVLALLGLLRPRRRHRVLSASFDVSSSSWAMPELDFSFSGSIDVSDADSLPDLTDDGSCGSVCSAVTPTKPACQYFDAPRARPAQPSIFEIPELVHMIVEFVDAQNSPHDRLQREKTPGQVRSHDSDMPQHQRLGSAMHSCLLVNRLFHRITKQVMSTRVFFSSEQSFYKFVRNDDPGFFADFRPASLVLNKLFCAKQTAIDKVARSMDWSRLEWLEIYMCPKLVPPVSLLHASLRSLVITGSRILDDALLVEVARRCPNLQVVDLRACEGITDYGVYAVATACTQLTTVNLGRKKRGHLITDHSVSVLACNNRNLTTVGLAGCYITDRSIWELAMNCGFALERLSLNNCPYISNQSLPLVLHHNLLPNLAVLEMRYLLRITNLDPIVTFRRQQAAKGICMLLEMCDELLARWRLAEAHMDTFISEHIFDDISEWVNSKDDDEPYVRA